MVEAVQAAVSAQRSVEFHICSLNEQGIEILGGDTEHHVFCDDSWTPLMLLMLY